MAYSYDFFVEELKCPMCGSVSPADDSTEMYTYIRDHANAEFLTTGNELHIDLRSIAEHTCDGYYTLKVPSSQEPVRLLNPWQCPTCGSYNWAEVKVFNDVIISISNVILNRAILEKNHLISNEADFVAASLLGLSWKEYTGQDTVRILLEKL